MTRSLCVKLNLQPMVQADDEDSKTVGRVGGLWVGAFLQLHITQRHLQVTHVTLAMYNLERLSDYFLMIIIKLIQSGISDFIGDSVMLRDAFLEAVFWEDVLLRTDTWCFSGGCLMKMHVMLCWTGCLRGYVMEGVNSTDCDSVLALARLAVCTDLYLLWLCREKLTKELVVEFHPLLAAPVDSFQVLLDQAAADSRLVFC